MAKAKDTDKAANAIGSDKTGTLSGLIADENQFDRRSLWRIGWWGVTAVGAVALAVLASETARDWRQDRIASADMTRQAQAIQSLARETQRDQRQLTDAIESLNTDRDRLYARLTVLEQGLESVTGSLRQTPAPSGAGKSSRSTGPAAPADTQPAAALPQAAPQAAVTPSPSDSSAGAPTAATGSPSAPASSSVAATIPTVSPVTTTNPNPAEKSRQELSKQELSKQELSKQEASKQDSSKLDALNKAPAAVGSIPGSSGSPSPGAASPVPAASPSPSAQVATNAATPEALVAPKSIMAPPDPAAAKLVQPNKSAQPDPDSNAFDTAAAKPGDTEEAAPTPAPRTEFAVDLGTASSLNGLRSLWRGLVKNNSDLAPLRPIVILKEGNNGLGMQLRLGAGPLNDAAAAAKICAGLAENKRTCETTVYDGQRLAVRSDDKEAAPEVTKTTPMQGQKGHRNWPAQRRGKREEPAAAATPSSAPAETAPASKSSNLSPAFHRS